ncbi:MAG: carboxymuconolactone decarboxylase family protein [Acidimicrobiia bacterium]|nr:carboxymuconolactone decarboxylase family protein [Acidimicrobiia bacterium]
MARIPLAELGGVEPDIAEMITGIEEATGDSTAMRVLAHRPDIVRGFVQFYWPLQTEGLLGRKEVELVRLGIAQINQCANCLNGRYQDSIDEGLTEEMVAQLPLVERSDLFTEREKAGIRFGQKMASDHWSVGDEDFARLAQHYSVPEMVELCVLVAQFIGIGRMFAVIDAMNVDCEIPTLAAAEA